VFDSLGYAVVVFGASAAIGAIGVNNGAGAVYIFDRSGGVWRLQTVLTDPHNVPGDGFGVSIASSGSTVMVGAPGGYRVGSGGAAYIYVRQGASWRLRATLREPRGSSGDFAGSVALAGTTALVGAPGSFRQVGEAFVYALSRTGWNLRATLRDPRGTHGDLFGRSVALNSTTVVIGAPYASSSRGASYVYSRSGNTRWLLAAALPDPLAKTGDHSGWSVALSGTTILVGAPGGAGVAYAYISHGTGWRLQAILSSRSAVNDGFGWSVAIVGMQAVIGAIGAHFNGAVYIYGRSGAVWHSQTTLTDPNPSVIGDDYGWSVADTGSAIVIGADVLFAGAAHVYVLSGNRWRRQADLLDPRGHPGSNKGASVAISGNTAVVGAWGMNNAAGAAFIYSRSAGRWQLEATLHDPSNSYLDLFGAAVAVSGSTVLVGAWNTHAGKVYVYALSGGRWRLQAELAGPPTGAFGAFGSSVAISGTTALIGDVGAHTHAGAAYVYVRSGGRWHRQATLADPRGRAGDQFGEAVALSGNAAVISADCEEACAGAAYVYARSGGKWRRQARLSDPGGKPNDGFGTSVALSGTTALIGAPGTRDYVGAAYVYSRSGMRWRRQAVLSIPRRVDISGGFGGAVAVSGTGPNSLAVISGLSVSGLVTERSQCGSAFEFSRPGGRWHERARIADPRCSTYDEFGYAAAISGITALIGAPGARSNSGAAYLLTLPGPRNAVAVRRAPAS
jgi:hypothetical protein